MAHPSSDDRHPSERRPETRAAGRKTNGRQAELSVVTEVDLTTHSLPISRVRWRPRGSRPTD